MQKAAAALDGRHCIIADLGASEQRTQVSVDESCCITATRAAGSRLWVAKVQSGEVLGVRPLSVHELYGLQGWSKSEFDKISSSGLSGTQLAHAAGNAMSLAIAKHLVSWMLPHLLQHV